jgi:hypothetical protein
LDDLVRSLDNIGVAALTRYFSALDFDDEEFIETGYSRAAEIVRWFGGNARAGMPTALVVGRSQYHELLALQPLLEVFGSLIERLPAVWPPGGESALFCESAIELLREVIMPESLAGPLRSWIEALGVRYDSGRMSENEVKLLLEFIRQCERDDVEDLEFASLKRKEIAPLTARLLYGETSSASASATTPE